MVHTDDLLEGWEGLAGLPATLAGLLAPLAEGRPGSAPPLRLARRAVRREARRWPRRRWWSSRASAPAPCPAARWATVLVWVEAPYDLRMRRGLERDGDAFAPHWEAWARAEEATSPSTAPGSAPTWSSTGPAGGRPVSPATVSR